MKLVSLGIDPDHIGFFSPIIWDFIYTGLQMGGDYKIFKNKSV